ncbi:MAG: hypothetical protein A2057_08145 [Ignavibacteria bacterium GWA2_35_9]|nr:MAG: hypothetical protein A2057_08145 [Ignavibacteria bacterium GWA2_35_9]OGU53542.1 MAG: hypothetical protein A2080_04405 [Ignavibacteria bacterium GWC2_36_12]OGV17069.1 MAG: hypothetical protein A3J84_08655 [Ignavibacteria bacterium RIFOXYA2_FULL_37_17]
MNKLIFSFFFLLIFNFASEIFSQNKNEFVTDLFTLALNNNSLSVLDKKESQIYSNEFQNPAGYLSDLNMDGNDEFLVKDAVSVDNKARYELYIYNLLDTFFLAGKINSGTTEPYEAESGEIEGLIIVAGNSDFSFMNKDSEFLLLPINCWKFEEGKISIVNSEIYDSFITENNNILLTLDSFFVENGNDCNSSSRIKSFIGSAYINYLNAGENSVASNFIETYYSCDDAAQFKQELDNIFSKENN